MRRVVESVKIEGEHQQSLNRWRAFGMDMLVESDKKLHKCRVEPANVEMVFRNGNPELEERFSRLGFVSEWMRKTVGEWLEKKNPEGLGEVRTNFENIGGHHVEKISGRLPVRGFRKLFGGKIEWSAAAWICPRDGRLYSSSRKSVIPRSDAVPETNGMRLSCCESINLKA
jgi:hypothetical protein